MGPSFQWLTVTLPENTDFMIIPQLFVALSYWPAPREMSVFFEKYEIRRTLILLTALPPHVSVWHLAVLSKCWLNEWMNDGHEMTWSDQIV